MEKLCLEENLIYFPEQLKPEKTVKGGRRKGVA